MSDVQASAPSVVTVTARGVRLDGVLSGPKARMRFPAPTAAKLSASEVLDDVMAIHHTPEDLEDGSGGGDLATRVTAFDAYELRQLDAALFNENEWNVSDHRVEVVRRQMRMSERYPAVVFDLRRRSIIDGTHRVWALKELCETRIWAWVGLGRRRRS